MSYGKFSGNPKTEWLADAGADRDMRVLEPFWYLDPDGRRWDVPEGTIINQHSTHAVVLGRQSLHRRIPARRTRA